MPVFNILKYISDNIEVLKNAPLVFILLTVLSFILGGFSLKLYYKKLIDTLKQRIELYKDREKNILEAIDKSGIDAEKIKELERKINDIPKIYTGDKPPKDAKDGDIWFKL